MQGTKFKDIMTAQDLINMSPKLTKVEWAILNDNIEYREARRKAASVLYFLKKHIILNDGFFSKSIDNIYRMFKRNNNYISTGQLKNIVNRLKELGLICIERVKKKNVYAMPLAKILSKKLANKKSIQPTENTDFEDDSKNHRDDILDKDYNTNTNIEKPKKSLMQILKEEYKGIKSTGIATKGELRAIAINILTLKGFGNNNAMHNAIQQMVFDKVKFSNQKIDRAGAVAYMEKVVEDRINAYNNGEVNVNTPKVANNTYSNNQSKTLRFNDFPQREYTPEEMAKIEQDLQDWDDEDDNNERIMTNEDLQRDLREMRNRLGY